MAEHGGSTDRSTAKPRRWRRNSRVARLRESHSYAPVLFLIAVIFVFTMAAPSETWARGVIVLLESATLAAALRASGLGLLRPVVAVFVLGVSVAVAQILDGGNTMTGLVWSLGVALLGTTMVVIALGIVDQGDVNRQSVSGAICVYLLVGILFAALYGAVAALGSGDFFVQGTDGTPAIRIYFSYVTLATLGYGDYTAAGSLGRTLAVSEALLGQLYLVTVVALLVGHFGMRRMMAEETGRPDESPPLH